MIKIRLDMRPVRVKILDHLAVVGGQEQRRWIRRYFGRMKGFKQAYRELLNESMISEQGRGRRGSPVMTVLERMYNVD